ncbi:hypothetical protein UAO_01884 [Enterococcus villorum ATCC 700913]|uniref:Uncharacterized protein n=1 Tax=Enterococcus villorum ATCC 700913 TaxID=1158604 RepID=A0ABP2UPM8_9ENTE|nr:hypothetical protein UAO_01884 [Enterococcus villorum ATCC 700913]EOW76416.1 hypothetical protein I591_01720 [Enterococcus villorum ATCC 700913]
MKKTPPKKLNKQSNFRGVLINYKRQLIQSLYLRKKQVILYFSMC